MVKTLHKENSLPPCLNPSYITAIGITFFTVQTKLILFF